MKYLHIHPSMAGGGIEAMVCGLANEMARSVDVTVCSIFAARPDHVFWHKLSAEVARAELGKAKPGFSLKYVWRTCRFIRRGGFNVVYLHGFIQYYWLAVILLHRRVRFCYTIHSDAKMENTGWSGRLFRLKRFFFARGWVTPITISAASQQSFASLYRCPSQLIYNGVPRPEVAAAEPDAISRHRLTPRTLVMLHPGRISLAKNQVVLCRAFDRLIRQGEDVVLLIAGNNQDADIFQQMQAYFSERIVYLGLRDDIPSLLAYADALCLPSIWEGLPVTLLEALSVGCIPICSPVGGIVNVVGNGDNGLLSASSSEDDYYAALKSFLAMAPADRAAMRRRCLASFAPYDIATTARRYLEITTTP